MAHFWLNLKSLKNWQISLLSNKLGWTDFSLKSKDFILKKRLCQMLDGGTVLWRVFPLNILLSRMELFFFLKVRVDLTLLDRATIYISIGSKSKLRLLLCFVDAATIWSLINCLSLGHSARDELAVTLLGPYLPLQIRNTFEYWAALPALGTVSRKSRELFGPEKRFVKLRPAYSVKLVSWYVVKGIKVKINEKFRASRRLRFEDTKRIMSPEIRSKSFTTFEKQAPGHSEKK